jgi:hypothetical protein
MKWLYFILSHSIFIALCAASLVLQTVQLLQLSSNIYLYGLVFFAVLSSYNIYWLLSKYALHTTFYLPVFIKKEIKNIFIVMLALVGVIFCYLKSPISLAIILPAFVLLGLYILPLLPIKLIRFTRKAGVLKTIVLAFAWAYVTVAIPLQKSLLHFNNIELFLLTQRFLFMLMLCIIFDSRDSKVDKIRGLHSLTTDISPKMLKYLVQILFLVLFATNFLSKYYSTTGSQSAALQISTLALWVTYFFSTKKQGYLFYYFWVDGLMLFSAIATYIASI